MSVLKARHVKAVLPDKASLPGWMQIGTRRVDTTVYMCEVVAGDACKSVIATGTANFTRGPQRTDKWLRFSFAVYSCRTEAAAQRLYRALPDYDPRPDGTRAPDLGDESAASSDLPDGKLPVASFHDKVRVGSTVLWTYAMGTEKAVTNERAEMAAELQTKRVQQAHKGLAPTASADVP
ncbi:hypothetical protein ACFCWG_48805 [Streptomyces sp. NPDC056390]|uniref:hypothetical protein n=1 Tax=Streptomyces sp. NPDC056390 TaxID=3345806 RepID=UPI0035E2696F